MRIVLLACFLIAAVAVGIIAEIEHEETKAQAIENGCAYHHPVTGDFTWKEGE